MATPTETPEWTWQGSYACLVPERLSTGVTAAKLKTFYPGGSAERDGTIVGSIVGAGVDVALTHNVFLRGEYDFSFFGKKTLEYCGGGCVLEHTVQTHDFRVGLAMKF